MSDILRGSNFAFTAHLGSNLSYLSANLCPDIPIRIEVKNIHRDGNKLDADFEFDDLGSNSSRFKTIKSCELIICGVVSVQVIVIYNIGKNGYLGGILYVCARELQKPSNWLYECKVGKRSSNDHSMVLIASAGGTCMEYNKFTKMSTDPQTSQLSFQLELRTNSNPKFYGLYYDEDLIDFKLCGIDGGITVHRQILAAQSPVMKTMLTGTWKETNEGRVSVAGTSVQTLMHLKKYLYLDQLPDDNAELEPLLVLSGVYMMKDLSQKCSAKILFNITPENAIHYTELAAQYKHKFLLSGILNCSYLHYAALASCDDNEWL